MHTLTVEGSALGQLDPRDCLGFDLPPPHITELRSVEIPQCRHVDDVLHAVLLDLS